MQDKNIKKFQHLAGFSLIELMIGMVIGLLVTLIVSQTMSVFEGQKRGTTGSADAQTNGGIALYNINRELKMAGYPLMPTGQSGMVDSAIECTTVNLNSSGTTSIYPVTVTEGTAGTSPASDSITIRYGDSLFGGAPTELLQVTGTSAKVNTNLGCQQNDVVLVSSNGVCELTRVSNTAGSVTGVYPNALVTLVDSGVGSAGDDFACLGQWNSITYSVSNGNLVRSVNGGASAVVVPDIVNLQAQYGISTAANSNQITGWVNATGATWAAPTVADRNKIKAVRIAVVARNPQMEPSAVTSACSSTTAASPTGLCAWDGSASQAPTLDLTTGNTDWAKYHYKVFETIIPLKNMIWSKGTI